MILRSLKYTVDQFKGGGSRASRDGRVVSHEIRKSSGFVLLDRETEALLQRAQPLPAFTSGMTAAYIDIVVPIDYSLRRR